MRVGAAGRTTFLYLVFGLIWILVGGLLVDRMFDDPGSVVGLELIKGSFFVIVSAALIYFTIARHAERVLRSEIESIERLKQSEERFRTLVEGISDHLVILLNSRGEIVTWNTGAETLTGFARKDVLGKHYRILFCDDERQAGLPEKILDSAKSGPVTTGGRRVRADGTSFFTDGTIAPIRDQAGSIAGFTKITRDLTETLNYQASLEKKVAQYSIIADIGREAIISDHLPDFGNTVAEQVARGLGADHVVMLHAGSQDSAAEITACWNGDDAQACEPSRLPAEEILAIVEACRNLDAAGATSLEKYPMLRELGFRSAAAVGFGSPDLGSRCLGALFRETKQIDDDDRHFLAAMARIVQISLTREQAQREIDESKTKLSLIINQVPAIIWTVDADLVIRSSTGSGLQLLDIPANRSVGRNAVEMLPDHAARVVREAVEGKPGGYRFEINNRLLETSVEPMRLPDGRIVGAIGLSIDITDRERALVDLQQSRDDLTLERDRLRMIVEQVPAVLWSVDRNLVFTRNVGSGLTALGLAPEQNVGVSMDAVVGDEHPGVRLTRKVIEEGSRQEFTVDYEGRYLRSYVEPMRDSRGEIIGALGLTLDVTEEKLARERIERSRDELEYERNRLRLFLEQLPAILWTVDRDLVVRSSAGAALSSINRSIDQGVGRKLSENVDPNSPGYAAVVNALEGTPGDVIQEYRGRPFRVHVEPLWNADHDTIEGAISLAVDVTDELKAQQLLVEKTVALENLSAQLIDAQETERERIARELHDEFGGMFTSLSFDVSWIRENASSSQVRDRAADMSARIDHAMKRVREVARELRPKVLDDFGLVPAIEDLVTSFSDRYGIETNLSSRPDAISLGNGLDIMLYRIVQEALTNIAKHSGATRAEVRLRRADHHLVAEIRDDGKGISPEEISGSKSLGIVGMRERTEILGGDLMIEPYEGKGTIVRVTIPQGEEER